MSNIVPFEEKRTLAIALVKSGLFGLKDEAQALSLMALCEAEGMHPAKAVQEYHIIQGRPAIKADALLARFQRAGGSVQWTHYDDARVVGVFTHPQGSSINVDWTIDRARKIGLTNKDNWKNYPRNMLRARCISEGVRAVFPGIATGIYTAEEVADMPLAQVREMGNIEVVPPPNPWTDELRDAGKAAAQRGTAAYEQWWKQQSKEFRLAAVKTAQHAENKETAQKSQQADGTHG